MSNQFIESDPETPFKLRLNKTAGASQYKIPINLDLIFSES